MEWSKTVNHMEVAKNLVLDLGFTIKFESANTLICERNEVRQTFVIMKYEDITGSFTVFSDLDDTYVLARLV